MTKLAKLAYWDTKLRQGSAVQLQPTEIFIDALKNNFIKDVARSNLITLSEALSSARERESSTKDSTVIEKERSSFDSRIPGRVGLPPGKMGLHTILRVPKLENHSRK